MRISPWLLALSVGLCACEEKTSPSAAPALSAAASPSAAVAVSPSNASEGLKVTPEQEAATVRVRVIVGGLPPKVYTGAILHLDALADTPARCQLCAETSGASITSQGLLRYTAPQVTELTRMQIAMEILGKDGQTVLHEFAFYVLPLPKSAPPPTAAPVVLRRPI